jgi:hypothetical protein
VIIALGIVAVLLVITFGGLRVGLAAWQQGEERAATLDHARSLVLLLEGTLAGTFPYPGTLTEGEQTRIIFDGQPDRLTFVTTTPLFPAEVPIAFTAVSLSAEARGLALRQQPLPNQGALDRLPPSRGPGDDGGALRYLGQAGRGKNSGTRASAALPRRGGHPCSPGRADAAWRKPTVPIRDVR